MLDDRKAAILRAVVEEYIETAQPVGSSHLARSRGIPASPATIRNEMGVLERDGYLVQPHTSAGRIPTDKGYRYFVDQLAEPGHLERTHVDQVRRFFDRAHQELEQMLHDTTRLLSNLTDYAAVVVAPSHDSGNVRSLQLVSLAPRVALLVVVLGNGVVEKRTVEFDVDTDEAVVTTASLRLSEGIVGKSASAPQAIPKAQDPAVAAVTEKALAALETPVHDEPDHVFVGGTARMAANFDAVETVRSVLSTLEEQYVVVTLLRDVLDRGWNVAIGTEHGLEPLAECSVVVSPYVVEGQQAGTVAVLGPTRMNYPHAMAAVTAVSRRLSQRLTEG